MISVATKNNEVLGFPDSISIDEMNQAISDDRTGTISEYRPTFYDRTLRPALEGMGINFNQPSWVNGRSPENTQDMMSADRAFATNAANSATFGIYKPEDLGELNKEHPVASIAGQFAGFIVPMKAISVGLSALKFPALVESIIDPLILISKRYPEAMKVVELAQKAIAGGVQTGTAMGIYRGVSETTEAIKDPEHANLLKIGGAVLHDSLVWGLAGAVSGSLAKPLDELGLGEKTAQISKDMTLAAGTLYAVAKAGGANDSDALLQGGMGAIFHLVNAAPESFLARRYAMGAMEKMMSDYFVAKNPMLNYEVSKRAAHEYMLNITEEIMKEELEKSLSQVFTPKAPKEGEIPAKTGVEQPIAPKMEKIPLDKKVATKVEREIADAVLGKILDNIPISELSTEAQSYLEDFKPKEPVLLYRAKTNFGGGRESRYQSEEKTESWTRSKEIALEFVDGDESRVETALISPDKILLDTTLLPKSVLRKIKDPSGDLGDIKEVIEREQEVIMKKGPIDYTQKIIERILKDVGKVSSEELESLKLKKPLEREIKTVALEPTDNPSMFHILDEQGGKIGYVGFTIKEKDAFIEQIEIANDKRSQGYGEAAVKEIMNLPGVETVSGQPGNERAKKFWKDKFGAVADETGEFKIRANKGESGQVNIALIPGVVEAAELVEKTHEAFVKELAPYNKGGEGKEAAQTMRENLGQLARSYDRSEAALMNAKKLFSKAKIEDGLEFMYRIEEGGKQVTSELDKITEVARSVLDTKRNEIQDLGTGKLEHFLINYFPHIWENPQKATDIFRKIMGKKPLQGPKSFLKQRTIESIRAGIEAGLKPVSYNPVDLILLKVREMDRYLMAHRTINALKEQGIVQFVRLGQPIPEGFVQIKDSIADVYSRSEKGELIVRGKYWAQEDAARIINNYLSPGLRGNYLYDLYRGAGNTLNQFQLGLSAFHLGFTSMDATISKFALGLNKLSRGDILGAAKSMASAPLAPITNFLEGRRLLQSWFGKDNGEMLNIIADTMATAGGRAKMDKFYATKGIEALKKSLSEGKLLTATLRLPFILVSEASRPIMEYLVPRQKLGVFADIMRMELERNPKMTHTEMRAIAQKAWDSVDNRMGQLVYDNLFWNKATKDLAMASVRSLGWNLGTIRELGGAGKDAAQMFNDLRQGKNPEVTYRMAYALALPIITGLYGAFYQYLMTGKGPQELKDYFFPKTGGLDKNGEPNRVSLPTYMKDLYHYSRAPVRTVLNKFNPVNNAVLQMLFNKDFYGTEIRNADDPLVSQVLSELSFLGGQFLPFGVRNLQRDTRKTVGSKVEPFIGITPAPYDLNMTKAELKAQEYVRAKLPVGARTKNAAEKSKLKADLRNTYQLSQDRDLINQARESGKISSKESRDIIKESKISPLGRYIKSLTVYELANVIKVASKEEKDMLLKEFRHKYRNKYNGASKEEKEKLRKLKVEVK